MTRCNCESSFCKHNGGLKTWPYVGQPCPNDATDSPYTMMYVGKVCIECAETARNNGGAQYIFDTTLDLTS